MRLQYDAAHFPNSYGAALQGAHEISVTWPEIIWAAISVGKGELRHLFQYSEFSTFEIIYRAAMVFANLQEAAPAVVRSPAYNGLDPSEKGAVSYFLGLMAAKLLAWRLLNTPWLMHLDVYRRRINAVWEGESRPDLVGRNALGQWIVIESKGRTNGFDTAALIRAKEQAEIPITIGGTVPTLALGMVTHFGAGELQCALDDPRRDRTRKPMQVALEPPEFFADYYRPLSAWLRTREVSTRSHKDLEYSVADAPEIDLTIGLSAEAIANRRLDAPREASGNEREFFGPDGIWIQTGPLWSQENMRREPNERIRTAAR